MYLAQVSATNFEQQIDGLRNQRDQLRRVGLQPMEDLRHALGHRDYRSTIPLVTKHNVLLSIIANNTQRLVCLMMSITCTSNQLYHNVLNKKQLRQSEMYMPTTHNYVELTT